MPPHFQHFSNAISFSMAGDIRDEIFLQPDNGWLFYIDDIFQIDDQFKKKAAEPCKETILHAVIEFYVYESLNYMVRKGDYESSAEVLERILHGYGISSIPQPLQEDSLGDWVNDLFVLVDDRCSHYIVDEIFTLLYSDREFLLQFNLRIADVVKNAKYNEHPDFLVRNGVVKRCTYWPKWLKNALYYRDKGRCALCLRDISGLLSSGHEEHIDHIVPLELGGY